MMTKEEFLELEPDVWAIRRHLHQWFSMKDLQDTDTETLRYLYAQSLKDEASR